MAFKFDATKLRTGFSVSNANKTVSVTTTQGTNDSTCLADSYRSSGKYYFEFVEVGVTNGWGAVGVTNTSASANTFMGGASGGISFDPGDNIIYKEGSSAATSVTSGNTLGDRYAICVDLDNKKFWGRNVTRGDGWNNIAIGSSNPATNTGGVSFSTGTTVQNGPWVVGAGNGAVTSGAGITLYSAAADWTGSPPSGFGEWGPTSNPGTVAFKTAGLNASLTLSNSDLTVEHTGADADANVRVNFAATNSGKYYAEFFIDTANLPTDSNSLQFGLATTAVNNATMPWADSNAVGTGTGGTGWAVNYSSSGATTAYTQGSRIGIAWDAGAGKVWMRVGGAAWQGSASGGSPAAGTSGFSFNPGGGLQVLVGLYKQNQKVTAYIDSASWFNEAPAGFVALGTAAAPDMPESVDEDAEDGSLSHWFDAQRARTFEVYFGVGLANVQNTFAGTTTMPLQGLGDEAWQDTLLQQWLGTTSPLAFAIYQQDWNTGPLADDAGGATLDLSASQPLDSPTQSTALAVLIGLTAAQTLPNPTQAATLWDYVTLTAAQTLDNPTQTASIGTPPATLTAAQTLAVPTQAAQAGVVATLAAASQSLAAPTQAATAKALASLTAAQGLSVPAQSASMSSFAGRSLVADQLLDVPANIFFGRVIATFAAVQTLSVPANVARVQHTSWDADEAPPGGWSADPSDILSWAPQGPATGSWS